jgi:hypothetical protein
MKPCPECDAPLIGYKVGEFTEEICWNCGYYASDSPAFQQNPSMFKNLVRDNPKEFMTKFLFAKQTKVYMNKKTDEDFTEPFKESFIDSIVAAQAAFI